MSNEASRVVVELVAKFQQYAADIREALSTHKSVTAGMVAASVDAEAKISASASRMAAAVKKGASEEAASGVGINQLLRDRIDLQARAAGLSGSLSSAESRALKDQALELKLINDYRRAGLTEQQAAVRAEEQLTAITVARAAATARAAAESSATSAKGVERFAEGSILGRTGGSLPAVAGIAVGVAIAGITDLAKKGLDYAHSLKQVSDELGITTHDLQIYEQAAQQSGVKTDEFRQSIGQLGGNLGKAQEGSEQQRKIFAALNIDIGNARDGYKNLSQVLPTLIDRLSQIPDKTRRFAIETALGGEQLRRLDPILSGGTEAFNKLAASIEATGGVLSDEQIQNADKTAVKLQALGDQLQRDLASTVSNNATAIENLATAFFRAADGALKFFSAMTNRGNLDILNSPGLTNFASGLLGNDPNKTRSQAFGDLLANPEGRRALAQRNAAALNELNRVDQLHKVNDAGLTATTADGVTTLSGGGDARTSLNTALPGLQDVSDTAQGRYAAYVKLNTERQRILAADRAAKASDASTQPQSGHTGDTSNLFAPKGKSAEQLENERLQRERQFNDQLAQAQEAQLRAQEQMTGDINKQADIEKELVDRALAKRLADIEEQKRLNINKGADSDLEKQRARQLAAAATLAATDEKAAIDQKRQIALNDAITASLQTTLGIEADLLNGRLALAQTAKERLKIELELLDNARKQKEVDLNKVINNPLASPGEKADAKARLEALPGQTAVEKKDVQQRNLGPLAAYLKSLPDTADKLDEALQGAAANGLQNLNDGLTTAIGHFLHLHGLAGQFLEDLIKIGLEREVIAPIANFLFPGAASAAGAAGGGGIFSAIAGLFGGTRAAGGSVVAGVPYLVGEHGPERFIPAQSGSVLPAGHVAAGGGGVTVLQTVAVDARGAVMNDEFASLILSRAGQQAAQIAAITSKAAFGQTPAHLAKLQNLGN